MKTIVLLLLLMAPVGVSSARAEGVDDAALKISLTGCWAMIPQGELAERQKDPKWVFDHQRCFDGKVFNTSEWVTCDGYESFDCWSAGDRYSVSKGRLLLRDMDDPDHRRQTSCEAAVDGNILALTNCIESGMKDGRYVSARTKDVLFEWRKSN
jgi:hypothetical protein